MTTIRGYGLFTMGLLVSACGDGAGSTAPVAEQPAVLAVPGGGEFVDAVVVQLQADRPSTIAYTKDGSTPTLDSPTYAGPLRLTESTFLTFMAVGDDGGRSAISTEYYAKTDRLLPPAELPAKSLRVRPDRLVFTPEPGTEVVTDAIELEAIGTEPVTVLAMKTGPAASTAFGYDPGAFDIVPSTNDPVIRPGEPVQLRVSYFASRTSRTVTLEIETDAENVARGSFPVFLFGRIFE